MNKLIDALLEADSELERRAILASAGACHSALGVGPEYPAAADLGAEAELSRDYLLLPCKLSWSAASGDLLFRFTYVGKFGIDDWNKAHGFDMISMASRLELASFDDWGEKTRWEEVTSSLLPLEIFDAIDKLVIEQERRKFEALA